MRILRSLLLTIGLVLVAAPIAHAVAPQFDDGSTLDLSNIYAHPQKLNNLFKETGVYGKLAGGPDVYSVTPTEDGDQTISLLGRDAPSTAAPTLVLIDPTTATEAASLNIPMPGDAYHPAIVKAVDGVQKYTETLQFQDYTVFATQRIHFQKDTTYYFIVFDPQQQLDEYILRFGEGKVWSAQDAFNNIGAWFRAKTDSFGGSSPFHFNPGTFGSFLFLLALCVLVGMWVVEDVFSFLANRTKMAGFILIKMQSFSRFFVWGALWFAALGGYIMLSKIGWTGLAFPLILSFILVAAVFLVRTLRYSPMLMKLEVSKQEATIPFGLRRELYAMFIVTVLAVAWFIVLVTMILV